MNTDFRERVFLPVILPLVVLLAIAAIAISLSRIFLAVPALLATFLALGVAGYVIFVAALIQAKPRISSRALGAGTSLALVALIASGVVAANAGMREMHLAGEEHAEEGEEAAADGEEEAAVGATTFVAVDIDFSAAPTELPLSTEIELVNEGQAEHNVVFDDLGEEPIVEAAGGQTDTGTVTFPEPGEYRYHCDVPGHEALMNGTVTVTE